MSVSSPSRAVKIFFSYATSALQDKQLFDELTSHLILLKRQHLVDEWYNSEMSNNRVTAKFLETRLNMVDIIILLISADFFASDHCYDFEMQLALELSRTKGIHLIPILLSHSEWDTTPLHKYQPLPASRIPIIDSSNRDAVFSEIAREIRLVVQEVSTQEKHVPMSNQPQHVSVHSVPYLSNDAFTDREETLARITSSFTAKKTPRTQVLALNGLAGMGKTQIALEYSYRSSNLYQTILWVNASSREVLSTEVSTLADQFSLSKNEDEHQLFAAFKDWLQAQPSWLLVLDQIVDLTLVDLIVPALSSGHVLLTTRTRATKKRASPVLVTSMPIDAAAQFLLHRANLLSVEATLDQASADLAQEAMAVAQALDGFPLALDQAGAYLDETGCSPADYLALYYKHEQRATLLSQRRGSADNHPTSVTSTLALAFEQVTLSNATNLELLHLFAFLHPDAIPEELLLDGAQELSEPLQSLVTDLMALHQAFADLRSFSLIERGTERKMLRIHRVVQAVLIDSLTSEQKRYWAAQAVRMVNHVFPEVSFDTWAECKRYLPQAQHCATLIHDFQLTLEEGAQLLERLGTYCYRRASYDEAETYLSQALHLYEQHLQANSPAAAQTLNSLGLLQYQQAQYQQAEALHQRALEIREHMLGPDDPKTAESLHNLAMVYDELGDYQRAEHLYLRVLSLEERAKGADDPDVATTLNTLGLTYYQQGNYVQAEAMYQRARTIYERALSPDHPELSYTLNGLGALAEKRGNYQQADELYQRALVIRKKMFGEEHPDVAQSINRLARVAQAGGDYQHAEALYQQALDMGEHMLGPQHPDVALYLNNLALLVYKQAQYERAEPLYQRALSIYEQALGAKSAAVANVLNNLGQLSRKTGREEQAEAFLRRVLVIREELLGMEHPSTAQSLSNLADLLTDQHKYAEAEPMLRQALAIRLQIFGPEHADVVDIRKRYASLVKRMT